MGQIKVNLTDGEICSCNVCFARNYEPETKYSTLGKYTPEIFDVHLGEIAVHLCRGCLETLGLAVLNVTVGGADHSEGVRN